MVTINEEIFSSYNQYFIILVTYGAQFIVVECHPYPNQIAFFSEPVTGKLNKANSCGEALAKVPPSYFFLSSVGTHDGVKYLFSDTPVHG